MHEGKVSLIISIHQIMVVLVDLNRRQLSLVDNVLVGKGADVEPVLQSDSMSSPLPKNIELSLEKSVVELLRVGHLRSIARSICRLQDNKGLQNDRLARPGSGTKKSRVGRRLSPSQNPQTQRLGNIFQLPLGLLQRLLIRLKEKVSHSILAQGGKGEIVLPRKVLDEELVGDRGHDTSTITISCIRAHSTTMGHVA